MDGGQETPNDNENAYDELAHVLALQTAQLFRIT
jgi:hypothetical protein